jgi:hypothetical protein
MKRVEVNPGRGNRHEKSLIVCGRFLFLSQLRFLSGSLAVFGGDTARKKREQHY